MTIGRVKIRFVGFKATAFAVIASAVLSPLVKAQSTPGGPTATAQSPTTTFQLQNYIRNTLLSNPGMPSQNSGQVGYGSASYTQPYVQPLYGHSTGFIPNHDPVLQSNSFGVPTNITEVRQSLTPNALATPNPVMPKQANRSTFAPSYKPTVPTCQKSQTLREMQPQLFGSH